MDFHSLARRELQAICKMNKIPANMTNLAMADALKALEFVEGLDDFVQASESFTAQSSIESPEKSEVTSPRLPPTGGRTTRRRTVAKEPQSLQPMTKTRCTARKNLYKDSDESKAIAIETPAVAARSTRRMAPVASTGKKIDSQLKEESEVKRVYSTRRSVRLAVKSKEMYNEGENEKSEDLKMELFVKEDDVEMKLEEGSVENTEADTKTAEENFEETDDSEVQEKVSENKLVLVEEETIQQETDVSENKLVDESIQQEVDDSLVVQENESGNKLVSAVEEEIVDHFEQLGVFVEEGEELDVKGADEIVSPIVENLSVPLINAASEIETSVEISEELIAETKECAFADSIDENATIEIETETTQVSDEVLPSDAAVELVENVNAAVEKKTMTDSTMNEVSDNKENILLESSVVCTQDEGVKKEFKDMSIRQLSKMLKQKLQITNKNENGAIRTALQVLPENQLVEENE